MKSWEKIGKKDPQHRRQQQIADINWLKVGQMGEKVSNKYTEGEN